VLELTTLAERAPGPGELRVRLEAIGVNFIDVYHREGRYPQPLPFTPGQEGAGVIEAVGEHVSGLAVGQRVAWAGVSGAYAEHALVPAERAVPVPLGLDSRRAAAAMLQGMTAHYLARSTHSLARGETALIHAAAGGVGLLLVQLAHQAGARVIGTVSTALKAELARAAGADEMILYRDEDFALAVKRLAGSVDVVYDSVGKDTFDRSLSVLRPRGLLVLYGMSSGPVPPLDLARLAGGGSLYLTRPVLGHYTRTRAELLERAGAVLTAVADGSLQLRIEHEYPLAHAAAAHTALEARKTTGKVLLMP
jgi:NADPH2:quinone reductase